MKWRTKPPLHVSGPVCLFIEQIKISPYLHVPDISHSYFVFTGFCSILVVLKLKNDASCDFPARGLSRPKGIRATREQKIK